MASDLHFLFFSIGYRQLFPYTQDSPISIICLMSLYMPVTIPLSVGISIPFYIYMSQNSIPKTYISCNDCSLRFSLQSCEVKIYKSIKSIHEEALSKKIWATIYAAHFIFELILERFIF